jgi:hypothetical protein
MRLEKYKAEETPKYSRAMLVPFTLPDKSNPAATRRNKTEITRFVSETEGNLVIGS